MSDAPKMPETIWAWFFIPEKQDDVMKGGWNDEPHRCEFEFTRTDRIADALIEAERRGMMRAAEIARLGGYYTATMTIRQAAAKLGAKSVNLKQAKALAAMQTHTDEDR